MAWSKVVGFVLLASAIAAIAISAARWRGALPPNFARVAPTQIDPTSVFAMPELSREAASDRAFSDEGFSDFSASNPSASNPSASKSLESDVLELNVLNRENSKKENPKETPAENAVASQIFPDETRAEPTVAGPEIAREHRAARTVPESTISDAEFRVRDASPLANRWIVSADRARQLLESGATLLDARLCRRPCARLRGAVPAPWQAFSQPDGSDRGKLLAEDGVLTEKLQDLGLDADRPAVVVGDPFGGWGEEGRIVWMLRSLGHGKAVLVDGGHRALAAAGWPLAATGGTATPPRRGSFAVRRDDTWSADRGAVRAAVGAGETAILRGRRVAIVDTRTAAEYAGATPYGEARGGHLPGAISLHYRELLQPDGRLKPRAAVRALLRDRGLTPDRPAIAYCTGGVRSAWFAAVLADLGYPVRNYAGSAWDWAASPAEDFPLETRPATASSENRK